ncbi:apoptotic chromatin condensation inducer in the nucleus-like [Vigna umbellata]|uniref:apoptotic chromatin condensation inducer in the nucleus-like n=1 Tax=Vigna umbellata TaxID=87088 RepID=UPI001F5EF753|nr:apoptotic chromatin condensation inducer in the nucleus-like [Vigna umbellata]XP_047179609.1 apoptotic chromatin condensation inducer in the nucleus-like [Vigna umbellata]
MRIRKRQVPFPLLPVTHSDPNLINRSPVMVQLDDAITTSLHPSCTFGSAAAPSFLLDPSQPSDQPLAPIGKPTNGSDEYSGEGETQNLRQQRKKQGDSLMEDERREEEGRGHKGNDTRKGRISWSETVSSSSPPKQDGRWSEGDKAFPPKKRRGTFENATEDNSNDEEENDDDDKKSSKMKMKRMKTKMNRKCSRRGDSNKEGGEEEDDDDDDDDEYEEEVTRETKAEVHVGKKRVRGGALMEGSRCSRVNGRGWRCCQQTLVGYSLCEHHLGKGRLRSMTSVRNKSIGTTSGAPKSNMPKSESSLEKQTAKPSSFTEDPLGKDAENNDEKKPVIVTKRRMKLGMVKARSISSLLGQSNTEIVAIAEDSDNK